MSAITKEQATEEVKSWLDYKKISEQKRAAAAGNIERIINGFVEGYFTMDPDTKVIAMNLKFPIGKDEAIKLLKFKPRLTVSDAQSRVDDVNGAIAKAIAYMGAATGEAYDVLTKMDKEDYHLAGDLVVFFMIPG